MLRPLVLLAAVLLAPPASAVLLKSGNGNTTPPADDPGWDNVGGLGGLNGVYLGYGWVLTAGHVNFTSGNAVFDHVPYPVVPGTTVDITHDGTHPADLEVFLVDPAPDQLPVLEISQSPPGANVEVTLIGRGKDRGDPIPGGFLWGPGGLKRWGKNLMGGIYEGGFTTSALVVIGSRWTQSLITDFDQFGLPDECIVTSGDSGSAMFYKNGSNWELAGINFGFNGVQGSALYGDDTQTADLSYYRDKIMAIVRPCADGEDNDGDMLIDLADPGCSFEGDLSEEFECNDGYDNDLDGDADYPADLDCDSASDDFEAADQDGDFVEDGEDNCLLVSNAGQIDANQDGYGNSCDADFDDDELVGSSDLSLFVINYGSTDPVFDLTGDGIMGSSDLTVLVIDFGGPPGPSGLSCAGTIPCP